MRTTINLEPDVLAAVQRLRQSDDIGVSAAVNRLARAGLARRGVAPEYVHVAFDMRQRIDVSNVGAVITLLDESGK